MKTPEDRQADWPEAMAEVIACHYDARAGRALAFGLTSRKRFRISYHYLVEGELHTGEFFSEKALPQGSLFPVHYDPDTPRLNRTHASREPQRIPLIVFGIAGSVVLSLLWLLLLRGCH